MITRRGFLKLSGGGTAAIVIGSAVPELGCGVLQTTWFQEAIKILQLVGPAVTGILTLLGMPVPALVNQVIQTLIELLQKYQETPIDQQPTILAQIEAAAKLVQSTIADILTALQIKNDKLKSKILALVNIVLGEISALIAMIPAMKAGRAALKASAQKIPAKTSGDFKKLFNAVMENPVDDSDPEVVNANAKAKALALK